MVLELDLQFWKRKNVMILKFEVKHASIFIRSTVDYVSYLTLE
jgi:hypothetical protein